MAAKAMGLAKGDDGDDIGEKSMDFVSDAQMNCRILN